MITSLVNSILSRCLTEAGFLDRMSGDPEAALRGYDLDERTRAEFLRLDVARVRLLGGFIAKIQNNHLWDILPATRLLIEHYGIGLEIFSAFQATHQRLRSSAGATRREKVEEFLRFLAGELDARERWGLSGLHDVFLHERLRWEAGLVLEAPPPRSARDSPGWDGPAEGHLRPVFTGSFLVGRFRVDPLAVESMAVGGVVAPETIPAAPRAVGYWGDPASGTVRMVELEPGSATLLELVDNSSAIDTITLRAGRRLGADLDPGEARSFFGDVCRAGLLDLLPPAPP